MEPVGEKEMKKLISMGMLAAFALTCLACDQKDNDKSKRGSRRNYRSVAQAEQIADLDVK